MTGRARTACDGNGLVEEGPVSSLKQSVMVVQYSVRTYVPKRPTHG